MQKRLIKEIQNAITCPHGTATEIVELKETVNNLESVMHSFDKHLMDVKAEIDLVPPVLYKTMLKIVCALNKILGEEVVPEPNTNAIGKEDMVQLAKQRAARCCKK
jgi:hypothetical protein